jgi:beta-galactosidase
VGYNYEEYRYAADHKQYPNRVIYGSENGMARQAWDAVDSNQYISGQFLWTGIDYLGEAGKWPQRSNGAGLIDLAGFKKPEYYYRQSLWAAKPMVYVGVKEITKSEDNGIWSHRNVQSIWNWPDGSKLRVECFTNCKEAELLLNGRSLGKVLKDTSKGQIPAWNVDYQPGELSVKGYNDGKLVSTYAVKTFGPAAQIKASPDQAIFPKSKKGICQMELQIADENGNPVYTAWNDIVINISGDARLLGLESGSITSHESYLANHRQAWNGRLMAYIQTDGKPGKINVSFNAKNLKPASVTLSVK